MSLRTIIQKHVVIDFEIYVVNDLLGFAKFHKQLKCKVSEDTDTCIDSISDVMRFDVSELEIKFESSMSDGLHAKGERTSMRLQFLTDAHRAYDKIIERWFRVDDNTRTLRAMLASTIPCNHDFDAVTLEKLDELAEHHCFDLRASCVVSAQTEIQHVPRSWWGLGKYFQKLQKLIPGLH